MPQYNPPLRDMQFVLHEVLNIADELKALPTRITIGTVPDMPGGNCRLNCVTPRTSPPALPA